MWLFCGCGYFDRLRSSLLQSVASILKRTIPTMHNIFKNAEKQNSGMQKHVRPLRGVYAVKNWTQFRRGCEKAQFVWSGEYQFGIPKAQFDPLLENLIWHSTTCSWINIFVDPWNNIPWINQSDLWDKLTVNVKFRLTARVKGASTSVLFCYNFYSPDWPSLLQSLASFHTCLQFLHCKEAFSRFIFQ